MGRRLARLVAVVVGFVGFVLTVVGAAQSDDLTSYRWIIAGLCATVLALLVFLLAAMSE